MWSRHLNSEMVFDQKVPTWQTCHRRASGLFGRALRRVIRAILKIGITRGYLRSRSKILSKSSGERNARRSSPENPSPTTLTGVANSSERSASR